MNTKLRPAVLAGTLALCSGAPLVAAAQVASGNDTLEVLHQKLSERLKSARQPTEDGTLLLKVPARAGTASSARTPPSPRATGTRRAPADRVAAVAWDYQGPGGPPAWARLKPEYATCGEGTRQSPVDLRDGFAVDLEPLSIDYRPAAFRVIDNGRTVQVNVGGGQWLAVGGRRYELQHLSFHRPSEVRIQGRQFDMDVHLTHRDEQGRLAILAVPLEQGAAQAVVQQVWNHLPLEKGEENLAPVPLDVSRLLPEDRRYFTHMGSLTTPPCTEGVLWMVFKQPVQVGADQIALFHRLYPMNARPVQPTHGRLVKESR